MTIYSGTCIGGPLDGEPMKTIAPAFVTQEATYRHDGKNWVCDDTGKREAK